jgi:hypothetical protein
MRFEVLTAENMKIVQNYWVFGLHPSSGTLKRTKEHDVSETGSVSVLR